jgi:UDP-glucuronate 4-epimerase
VAIQLRTVLLTGGAGFIGSHVSEALLRQGIDLTVVDNLDEFYPRTWKKANLEEIGRSGTYKFLAQDICDGQGVRKVFADLRPDAVIHLAARAGVRPSIEQPRLYDQVNVAGTLNLLEACREFGVQKFIFGSSSSVYGATSKAPFSEEHVEGRPISPYAASKLAGELYCYTYSHLHHIPIVSLRFFTVYGPRQRPDLAIYKFVANMEKDRSIPVFGDGSTGRDYTYVEDIVAGVLGSLNYDPHGAGAPYDVFNLGNSHPVKLTELLTLLERATGHKAVREQRAIQPGDVPLTWADISKAERLLGYRPRVNLENGIERFVAWYRSSGAYRSL